VGCGQCYIVCRDAGGQALEWEAKRRRPKLVEEKCLSCMICSFICPVPSLISFKEMPKDFRRKATRVMDEGMIGSVKLPVGGREAAGSGREAAEGGST
jgi:MinD superfamily P-loop ATPase